MVVNVSKEDIKLFEKLNTISQITPLKERIKFFEQKYDHIYEEYNKDTSSDEDFQKWNDYIEWKAYVGKLKDLELKLIEIEK
jgi:hypothetical protein